MKRKLIDTFFILSTLVFVMARAVATESTETCPNCESKTNATSSAQTKADGLSIPDVLVTDQQGRQLHFVSELAQERPLVVNFIFTSCPTVCPLLGANFGKLQALLKSAGETNILLVSISIDPLTDTPQRLAEWGARFKAADGWSMVTGGKREVESLLHAFQIPTGDKLSHQPLIMVGRVGGKWNRINGLAPANEILEAARQVEAPAPHKTASTEKAVSPAHHYFSDVVLVDQDGRERRLYSDLMEGKTVLINSFFSSCRGTCPIMLSTFAKLQERLGDRMGKDVYLLSITVDPENDTPEKLKAYAEHFQAKPGWYFLTGKRENLAFATQKLGLQVKAKENHSNLFIMGNVPTGLWKKVFGLTASDEVYPILEGVMNDSIPAQTSAARLSAAAPDQSPSNQP